MIRIYFDSCCFSRPFDDQSQARIHAETEAIRLILEAVARGEWDLISSEAVELEASMIADPEQRVQVLALATMGAVRLPIRAEHVERARVICWVSQASTLSTWRVLKLVELTCSLRPTTE